MNKEDLQTLKDDARDQEHLVTIMSTPGGEYLISILKDKSVGALVGLLNVYREGNTEKLIPLIAQFESSLSTLMSVTNAKSELETIRAIIDKHTEPEE